MQSTGHSSTHALSLTSMQALAMTYGTWLPPSAVRPAGQQVADLEALELPGRGLGQVVDEHDVVRRLEVREAVAAPGDQVLGADALGDDHGHRLVDAVLVGHTDDGGLPHGRVLDQPALDLGRRHPDAAGLEHVAVAAQAGEVAVGIAD